MTQQKLETIMTQLESGAGLSTQEILGYAKIPEGITSFVNALKKGTATQRQFGVSVLIDMGRYIIPAHDNIPEWPGPIVVNQAAIDYLVQLLDEPNSSVRGPACIALAALVPGDRLKSQIPAILSSISRYPGTDGAIVLLGKTGSDKAIELLNREDVSGANPDDAEMALARLGITESQDALIKAYFNADDVENKALQARRLGYVSSDRTKQILAEDIRTPLAYMWHPPARRSLRIHIIEALHLAFPEEPIFWRPIVTPFDDSYYQAIEDWLTKTLGTTWTQPRPDFLYEEDSPIMPSQKH